jgi:hypothetical protein
LREEKDRGRKNQRSEVRSRRSAKEAWSKGHGARSRELGVGWVERSKKMNVQHRTSNVQHRMKKKHPIPNIAEFQFFGKAFIPGKSKIRNPKSKHSSRLGN